jgi:TPR repeat protein
MSYLEHHRLRSHGSAFALVVLVLLASTVTGLAIQRWRATEATVAHGAFRVAERDFRGGQEQAALALFKKLADANDPRAQYWLGHMTELGLGAPRDTRQAISLYQRSATQNYVPAELRLGEIYLHGDLVPPDFPKARSYLERAANAGDARAALLLGRMYRLALGVPADPKQACAWLEVSAIEGDAAARPERDSLMSALGTADQQAVSRQAKTILADVRQATRPAATAKAAQPHTT